MTTLDFLPETSEVQVAKAGRHRITISEIQYGLNKGRWSLSVDRNWMDDADNHTHAVFAASEDDQAEVLVTGPGVRGSDELEHVYISITNLVDESAAIALATALAPAIESVL